MNNYKFFICFIAAFFIVNSCNYSSEKKTESKVNNDPLKEYNFNKAELKKLTIKAINNNDTDALDDLFIYNTYSLSPFELFYTSYIVAQKYNNLSAYEHLIGIFKHEHLEDELKNDYDYFLLKAYELSNKKMYNSEVKDRFGNNIPLSSSIERK